VSVGVVSERRGSDHVHCLPGWQFSRFQFWLSAVCEMRYRIFQRICQFSELSDLPSRLFLPRARPGFLQSLQTWQLQLLGLSLLTLRPRLFL